MKPSLSHDDLLMVYPNPSADLLNIRVPKEEIIREIWTYNMIGQVLYHDVPQDMENEGILDLKLSKGLFIIKVQTENLRMCRKLIIQ